MRTVGLVGIFALGCAPPPLPAADAASYLGDATYRRQTLVSSLVNPDNGYSRLRLQKYATGSDDDWDRLPEWNPAVAPVAADELDRPGGVEIASVGDEMKALALPDDPGPPDLGALVALGQEAFRRYPSQLAAQFSVALRSRQDAARYGLWVDDQRGVGGVVRVRVANGTTILATTCSTCHAARHGSEIEDGLPDAGLAFGALLLADPWASFDPAFAGAVTEWGPGRLDVTTPTGREPARIPDLRPVRWLTHLQQDATVAMPSISALAIRIETLLITGHGQSVRPPRLVALAIAAYLQSLADALPTNASAEATSPRGAALFEATCTACHSPPGLTGAPVPIATIGTDPTLGLSADRGTGFYRVPSLHGVGSRPALLHDGTLASLAAMFDPARQSPSFTGSLHRAGAIPGHTFGLDLSPDDRAALLSYLQAL